MMIHGFLNIDKPVGITSAGVVAEIKRILSLPKSVKIGHAGTLDPLASGVLPIALGEATKVIRFLTDAKKGYRFQVTWGRSTTTDDREGDILEDTGKIPLLEDIEGILPAFTGKILQIPPIFSALKVNGQRAYDLARAGENPNLKSREIEVFSLKITAHHTHATDFEVECSKGTYIRSLARDMGKTLGCQGYISALRRTKVGKFSELDAFSLDFLKKHAKNVHSLEMPLETALDDILAVSLSEEDAKKLKNGQGVRGLNLQDKQIILALFQAVPLALCEVEEGVLKPLRGFNLKPL